MEVVPFMSSCEVVAEPALYRYRRETIASTASRRQRQFLRRVADQGNVVVAEANNAHGAARDVLRSWLSSWFSAWEPNAAVAPTVAAYTKADDIE